MIESDVVRFLKKISIVKDFEIIVETDNRPHPMDKTFVLVGEGVERDLGTSSQTLTSRDGTWTITQPVAYDIRIGIQGIKRDGIGEICGDLRAILDVDPIRYLMDQENYTYEIGNSTLAFPVVLNTDQYVRHSFNLRLKTTKYTRYENFEIKSVQVGGTFMYGDRPVHEYKEDIPN